MNDIDRLHLHHDDIIGCSTIVDSPSGEYVLYDDHLAQLQASEKREKELVEALSGLVHLHNCEQEGLELGKPTYDDWVAAVNNAENVLTGSKPMQGEKLDV